MNFNEFEGIIKKTRCTRRFDSNYKVKTKDLIEIIDLSRNISSATNTQPLRYIIINDDEHFNIVHKPVKWATNLKEWQQSENEKPSAYILILNDTSFDSYAMIDAGIAIQTIMLSLTIKGLSGCVLASIDKTAYKQELNLPKNIEPMLAIAVGKGDEKIDIVDVKDNNTNYYRDENNTHCVPKRSLEDILLKVYE